MPIHKQITASLGVVERLPDSSFDRPVPAYRYGSLTTGADLLHHAAEHTFYHDGQIQMLELCFTPPGQP